MEPQHLVLSAGDGAIKADEHYRETGHRIEVFAQKRKFQTRDREMTDLTKKYKCTQCDFESFNGKRLAKFYPPPTLSLLILINK